MQKPILNQTLLLQKFPGIGGWTYAEISREELLKETNPGWVKVKGLIENYKIEDYSLSPWKEDKLFLPVKAEIRKKIKKQAGDHVKVVLYLDDSVFSVPAEIIDCLLLEPLTLERFNNLSKSNQKQYVKWIYSAKKEETKAQRINKLISKLLKENEKNL